MSQEDIVKVLCKNRFRWWSASEIAEKLSINRSCLNKNLASLRKWERVYFVRKKIESPGKATWSFFYKLKTEELYTRNNDYL